MKAISTTTPHISPPTTAAQDRLPRLVFFGRDQQNFLAAKTQRGKLAGQLRGELMTSNNFINLRHAALATSLLSGTCLRSQELPGHHRPQHAATISHTSQRDLERLSPYIAPLHPREISPEFAQHLISHHGMSAHRSGVVLDAFHLIFVSWDERGIVFDKSVFQSPRSSHSAVIALRTTITASGDSAERVAHRLQQRTTLISFLPSSARAIRERVRVDLSTIADLHGAPGTNWQGLNFLFNPNAYLGGQPILVSASNAVPVPESTYWATVRRAAELDRQGKPYHVLSSAGLRRGTENCITGVGGIVSHLPGAQETPFTGPLRGQAATDLLASAILEASGVHPHDNRHYEAAQDVWILREFVDAVPEARSGIRWYILRKPSFPL
jgi:hypothetical protein